MQVGDVQPVARLDSVTLRYRNVYALAGLSLEIPAGRMVGLIGPDGIGKSSLLAIIAGARAMQTGKVEVLGADMAKPRQRKMICTRIAYLPQGLGRNLYPTLSVYENIDFFARLFGQAASVRARRIDELARSTGLTPFINRPARELSGGMKQKLGLCCALIHDPDLLILDEPTTGIDPLSRRQFWELIAAIRLIRPGMSVVVATAYIEEAARFDWLVAMDAGRVLATGTPEELRAHTGAPSLDAAFIALLPEEKRRRHQPVKIPPRPVELEDKIAVEARGLTMRFGNFKAVDDANFTIRQGELFGFVGSNGCGKTTTMKMLAGLLPPSEGRASLFGKDVDARDLMARRRIGYMSQSFSLYTELTVSQNLELHARLFQVPYHDISERVAELIYRFDLVGNANALPKNLPLGYRQRLSLAVAMIHKPDLLILDEPTSGVDPVARDAFWRILLDLSRKDGITIFISTHFMNEAERCDRVALMHEGKVLAVDRPDRLKAHYAVETLEEAFVSYLEEAGPAKGVQSSRLPPVSLPPPGQVRFLSSQARSSRWHDTFNPMRMLSYARREMLELLRDPVRLVLALLGSVLLLFVMGYGISLDVENLSFAVLDRDQSTLSRNYTLNLAGSRYFVEKPPLISDRDMDHRMRSGALSLAIEIPSGFARDVARGRKVEIGAWVDGAVPARAEVAESYIEGLQAKWLSEQAGAAGRGQTVAPLINIETRFRYNPDVKSIIAMVPAMIPLLLMLIPAMLSTLGVVREKELGSIVNFYVTPTTPIEFLLGKQMPYMAVSILSFVLLFAAAVTLFGVPFTGSFLTLTAAAMVYVAAATALGLLISSFIRSQIAAIFGTAVLTILPAVNFSGMIEPTSSLRGVGWLIGKVYPTTYFLIISRGTFSKALGLASLKSAFIPLLLAVPLLVTLSALLLRKQER